MRETLHERLAKAAETAALCVVNADLAAQFALLCTEVIGTVQDEGVVLVCGNGGSASQASHLVAELLGRFVTERPPIRAVDLTSCAAVVTCLGNDYGYERVFARQVQCAGELDVLVCLSTSGTSPNIVEAASVGLARQLRVVAITGECGPDGLGALPLHAHVRIPSRDTARVQEMTLVLLHALCAVIDASEGRGVPEATDEPSAFARYAKGLASGRLIRSPRPVRTSGEG